MTIILDVRGSATLVRRYVGRLLDISSGGCLVEIDVPLVPGAVGRLEALIDGQLHVEAIRVSRVNAPATADAAAQVGLEFLIVAAAGDRSIRAAMHRLTAGADAIVTLVH